MDNSLQPGQSRFSQWLRRIGLARWSPWPLVAIGLAIIGTGLGLDLRRQYHEAQSLARDRISTSATLAAQSVGQRLAAASLLLNRLDSSLTANPLDAAAIVSVISGMESDLIAVLLIDTEGRVAASSRPEQVGADLSAQEFLWSARADADVDARLYLTLPPAELASSGRLVARARRSLNGSFSGVVALILAPSYFDTALKPLVQDGISLSLLDADGQRVASYAAGTAEPAAADAYSASVAVEPALISLDRPWSLEMSRDRESVFSDWSRQARFGLLLWLLVALVAGLAGLIATLRRREMKRLRGLHRRLLQGVDEGLAGIDGQARIRFANSAFARHLEQSPGALLGADLRTLLRWPEPGMDPVSAVIAGELPRYEGNCQLGSNAASLRATITPTREDGAVSGALLAFADPVTNNGSSNARSPADRLYRTLFDLSPDAVLIVDLDSEKPLAFNPAAAQMLGYSQEQFGALRVRDHEAHAAPIDSIRHIARVLAEGRVEFETRYRTSDGAIKEVQVRAQTIEFAGRPALYWIVRDIHEAKRIALELQQSAALMRALVDHLPLPFLVFEGDVLSFSNARYDSDFSPPASGISLEDWLTRHCTDAAACDNFRNLWQRLDTDASAPLQLELSLLAANQQVRVFDLHGARVGTRSLLLLVDLTERRLAEVRLGEARELAERANRARSEFLANMSHEIRTPMTAILGLTYLLQKSEISAVQRDQTQKIDAAARALLAILDDLLDYSKLETGRIAIEQRPFRLSELTAEITALFAPGARSKSLALKTFVDPAIPAVLIGDPLRLRQVLMNLVGNALKFTEQGEIEVRMSLLDSAGDRISMELCVRDTGIGIEDAQLERIFEPFYQAETSSTRRFGGTGLGLPITQWLITLMGGSLSVDSRPGAGSEFRVQLAFGRSDDAHPAALADNGVSTALPSARRPLEGMSVLLVEDHPINRHVAREILIGEGAAVAVAGDGQEAITQLRERPGAFHAVLMDIQMPQMDGFEATAIIRGSLGLTELPIIAVTANSSAEDRAQSRAAGMNAHLAKPIDVQSLVATLLALARPGSIQELMSGSTSASPGLPDDELPVLALEPALARLAGHRTLYAQMARLFAQEQGESVSRLRTALSQGDRIEAARAAHTLKGVAATLGAEALSALSSQLERALKRGTDPEELQRLSDRLADALAQAIVALERAAEELAPAADHAVATEDFESSAFVQCLDRLVVALVDSNMAALDHFSELRELATADLLPALRNVEDALGRLDFSTALDACRRVEAALEAMTEDHTGESRE
ncbi:MAG: ATP-binding protein [Lysobacterales bacterium]